MSVLVAFLDQNNERREGMFLDFYSSFLLSFPGTTRDAHTLSLLSHPSTPTLLQLQLYLPRYSLSRSLLGLSLSPKMRPGGNPACDPESDPTAAHHFSGMLANWPMSTTETSHSPLPTSLPNNIFSCRKLLYFTSLCTYRPMLTF